MRLVLILMLILMIIINYLINFVFFVVKMFAVPSSAFLPFQVLLVRVRRSEFCFFAIANAARSKYGVLSAVN